MWHKPVEPSDQGAEAGGGNAAALSVPQVTIQQARVTVDAGYHPSRVTVRAGVPLRMIFDRRDDRPCSERVIFPDTGIEAALKAGSTTIVDLPPLNRGSYRFLCGTELLYGAIEAVEA